ncbi:MAG: CDP-archaeol synthase [Candidatus Binatia bacterium]
MELLDVIAVIWFFVPAYAADMSPILARGLLPSLDRPIDGGRRFRGEPILGSHKTWRGLVACAVAGSLAYAAQAAIHRGGAFGELALIDYDRYWILPGLLMGIGAGVGDAVKSFFKRRAGVRPGSTWFVFDQLDFFVGALVFVVPVYVPPPEPMPIVVPIIFACEIAATAVFHAIGLKETWI